MGRSTYYVLPLALRPHTLKIGRAVRILESPQAYLARVGPTGSIPLPKRPKS